MLKPHSLPVPTPSPKEVLIALDTAGVGGWDAAVRGGWYPFGRPRFPVVLGTDGAGIVAAVGARVRRFSRGDRVYSYEFHNRKGGFYAEFVAVSERKVGRVPRRMNLRKAGAIPTTGLTALQGIDDALRVRKGETVLIHGAAGGVGSLAVQFARWRGARVIATATGRDGAALARRLGAAAAIDGKRADFAEALKRLAPDGVDALLAFAGGEAVARCMDAVRRGGRAAYPNGVEPPPRKRRGIRLIPYDAVSGRRELDRLSRAVEGANLRVPIAKSYPLSAAALAHRRLARGHVLGKIALRIR